MNIQNAIGKGFGSKEIAYYVLFNAYFGPIITNRLHATHNYEPIKSKFEIDYYR